jgi:hypothetical protein
MEYTICNVAELLSFSDDTLQPKNIEEQAHPVTKQN